MRDGARESLRKAKLVGVIIGVTIGAIFTLLIVAIVLALSNGRDNCSQRYFHFANQRSFSMQDWQHQPCIENMPTPKPAPQAR